MGDGQKITTFMMFQKQDAKEAIEFYAAGKIHPTCSRRSLEDINQILGEMKEGKIDGRVVIEY